MYEQPRQMNEFLVFKRRGQAPTPGALQVQQTVSSTSMMDLGNLDEQMKRILDDPSYPDAHAKSAAYKQVLNRYLEMSRRMHEPVKLDVVREDPALAAPVITDRFPGLDRIHKELDSAVGAPYNKKTHRLLALLMTLPEFGWNERGEIRSATSDRHHVNG